QCSQCKGAGSYYKEKCASCYGTGYQTVRKKIAVKIPAGVDSGNKVAIGGLGEPGGNGGPRGDLYVVVNVSSHPVFEREDLNIFSTVPISFATAALGATIKIQTIDGYVDYDVKPGTQPNTKLRLRGKGVPYYKNPQVRGDQYVTLRVVVPEKLTKEQKDALVEFDKAMNGGTSQVEETAKKKKGLFK
ncbi:MAG TPA: molecular chaperone DnaJ, partial [Eubacterium sp.]|nr:molecular chaperone DnaJ [Eubacterium sp.]